MEVVRIALPQKSLVRRSEFTYEIPTSYKAGMRVPGLIFASPELMRLAIEDKAIEQVANVAFLPGIVKASMAMPDIHRGYGFPIGGVAATAMDGVVSPGGVGFDISCGVRLLRSDLVASEHRGEFAALAGRLARDIPKGLGAGGRLRLDEGEIGRVLKNGAKWAVGAGYGWQTDLDSIEHGGCYEAADPDAVSQRAKERGRDQVGTIGSGNHFVEVQEVREIYSDGLASALGLFKGQLVIMIHSGSRGLGHQVCTDFLKEMAGISRRLAIDLPDQQLACAPVGSSLGARYLAAMQAAANFGLANRECLGHWVCEAFAAVMATRAESMGMSLVYDVSHNVAQIETHLVDGREQELCVQRKGATRAFGPGRPEIPEKYRGIGQPVMVPGDMGTNSYCLVGTEEAMRQSFGSTCHGAGRIMSRTQARKQMRGAELQRILGEQGIIVRAGNIRLLAEEAPYAYKDVMEVVDVCEGAGLSKKVAKMRPLIVIKG